MDVALNVLCQWRALHAYTHTQRGARLGPYRSTRLQFPGVIVSKLALNAKVFLNGRRKKRIIVTMRRSGANSCAVIPYRIVPPRINDPIWDAKNLFQTEAEAWRRAWARGWDDAGWSSELALADFSDAH